MTEPNQATDPGETIQLSSPLRIEGSADRTTLSMREPSVGDMLVIKKQNQSPEEQELALFSNLCEIAPTAIRNLKWKDYRKLQKAFSKMVDDENPLG